MKGSVRSSPNAHRFNIEGAVLRSNLRSLLSAALLIVFLGIPTPDARAAEGTTGNSPAPRLQDLLRRFNETQQATRSLTATFTERKNLSLLARPVISTGTFLY